MHLKYRCTQHRRTTKNSKSYKWFQFTNTMDSITIYNRHYMSSHFGSNLLSLILSLWELSEVLNVNCLCWVLCASLFTVECGGKMHLREGEYEKAHTDFFEVLSVDLYYLSIHFIWMLGKHLITCLITLPVCCRHLKTMMKVAVLGVQHV
jgi:hypothetical protein